MFDARDRHPAHRSGSRCRRTSLHEGHVVSVLSVGCTLMRLLVIVVVVVLLGGCATTRRHVYVPKSSAPCWRECKAMSLTCLNGRGTRERITSYDPQSLAERCEDERLDCLLTCPGARETSSEVEAASFN